MKQRTAITRTLAHMPCLLLLELEAGQAGEARLRGLGSRDGNAYFDRYPVPVARGRQVLHFPLPIAPKRLAVQAMALSEGLHLRISSQQVHPMALPVKAAGLGGEFIAFAKWFSRMVPKLEAGMYKSAKGGIKLRYAQVLRDEDGHPVDTPARVDVAKPYIEVSRDFTRYTVPMRMFILCHEFGHYLHRTFDELLADQAGIELYLQAGFPKTEAFYALTDVLPDTAEAHARMERMYAVIMGSH